MDRGHRVRLRPEGRRARRRPGDRGAAGASRCGDAPRLSGGRPGRSDPDLRVARGTTGRRLRQIPCRDRCRRDRARAIAVGGARIGRDRADPGGAAARRGRGAPARHPGTRGGPGQRCADRPAGPRRSRPDDSLHGCRRDPRRGDLRLEHRDRGHLDRCIGRAVRPAPTGSPDGLCHRGLHDLRRTVGVGGPGGRHGRRRAPGAGTRATQHRCGRDRVGRDRAAPR